MPNKLTTEEFIKKARESHGDKYDYSLVDYQGRKIPVTIICLIHGEFSQTPGSHTRRGLPRGCPECGLDRLRSPEMHDWHRKSESQFISEAKKVHGNKYDYSLVNYHQSHRNVTIICSQHGNFDQTPNNHLKGRGCPRCGQIKRNKSVGRSSISKGERFIKSYLEKSLIKFQFQWFIPNSYGKAFDFYLPEYNLFIEFHGEQHYKGWSGKEENLRKKQHNDQWKANWAKENGYDLLVIPYWEIDNIADILSEF